MKCWNCAAAVPETLGKIAFRAECQKCSAALHSCSNCKYYKPGLPNDCSVPGTEWVRDRQKNNLCEDFSPLTAPAPQKMGDIKKRFEDLFH